MKVFILKSHFFEGAGLEKYARSITKAFVEKGHSVTVLTTGPVSDTSFAQVVSFPVRGLLSVQKVLSFDRACAHYLAQEKGPSLIFGLDRNRFQTHLRAGNGVHAAYLKRRKESEGWAKALSFSLNPLHHTLLRLERQAFEHPDLQLLITNSSMVRQEVLSSYDVDPKKIQVLHNGVEWGALAHPFACWQTAREEFLRQLNLPSTPFHFLFVGHNFERKGLPFLLRALPLLKTQEIHLSVVGTDKHLRKHQHMAESLGLSRKVSFFGRRKDIHSFYQMADAVVIPSLYDPFANVTVEALAMGTYVVSSKTNGGHEVLQPTTGSVIENLFDPVSVANALDTALNHPKTAPRATSIRSCVKHLDYPLCLDLLVQHCSC